MFRKFQARLSLRLLMWSLFSMSVGFLMLRRGTFWKSVGQQFISWGAIDGLIALGGQFASDQRLNHTPPEELPEQIRKDKRNLRIMLWINAGLDVLYVIWGLRWMRHEGESNRGNGVGVLIQGLFLLLFDIYHGLAIGDVEEPAND